jgi:hypothetical protein
MTSGPSFGSRTPGVLATIESSAQKRPRRQPGGRRFSAGLISISISFIAVLPY